MEDSDDSRLQLSRSPAGEPIAECELAPGESNLLAGLTSQARARGAARLCVYSTQDLRAAGFERREGYRRLVTSAPPPEPSLPVLDPETVRDLWPRAFTGQWGHHQVQPSDYEYAPDAVYVGLCADGAWIGLCRAEPGRQCIDGPGFLGPSRDPDAARALVLGAWAHLGAGPVTLETWGDGTAPYLALGFTVAEECPGWELALG